MEEKDDWTCGREGDRHPFTQLDLQDEFIPPILLVLTYIKTFRTERLLRLSGEMVSCKIEIKLWLQSQVSLMIQVMGFYCLDFYQKQNSETVSSKPHSKCFPNALIIKAWVKNIMMLIWNNNDLKQARNELQSTKKYQLLWGWL